MQVFAMEFVLQVPDALWKYRQEDGGNIIELKKISAANLEWSTKIFLDGLYYSRSISCLVHVG